ncbi:MAG: YkgJ family cysteine cluster protein [Nitrospira sp.]
MTADLLDLRLVQPSQLFQKTSQWFDRAGAALLGTLPCRQGCSHCCIGLFPVTLLDKQEVQRGLRSLPDEQRRKMEEKAREQVSALAVAAPALITNQFIDHWPDGEIDRVIERFDALPCPALERDGSCGLYDFRPLVCRSMGIPTDDGVRVHGACAVQTAVPLIRLSNTLREQESRLVEKEAEALGTLRDRLGAEGEELLLPYAFLPESEAGAST